MSKSELIQKFSSREISWTGLKPHGSEAIDEWRGVYKKKQVGTIYLVYTGETTHYRAYLDNPDKLLGTFFKLSEAKRKIYEEIR